MALKRYAQVGTGGRARMYYEAVASKYSKIACMVGFCDQSQTRMNYANSRLEELGAKKVPTYLPHEFEKMIQETKPDVVLLMMNLGKIMGSNFERLDVFANTQVRDYQYQLAIYIYEKGLANSKFSMATAVGLFQSMVGLLLVLISDRFAKALGEDGLM